MRDGSVLHENDTEPENAEEVMEEHMDFSKFKWTNNTAYHAENPDRMINHPASTF